MPTNPTQNSLYSVGRVIPSKEKVLWYKVIIVNGHNYIDD